MEKSYGISVCMDKKQRMNFNEVIERVFTFKYLGIVIDDKLGFDSKPNVEIMQWKITQYDNC